MSSFFTALLDSMFELSVGEIDLERLLACKSSIHETEFALVLLEMKSRHNLAGQR